ncbi:MAG: FecR family protein [bacterium]
MTTGKKFTALFFYCLAVCSFCAEISFAQDDCIAMVNRIFGSASALKEGASQWITVKKDDVFASGDIIKTGEDATCELYLIDGTIFEIGNRSTLKIQDLSGDKKHLKRAILDLEIGELLSTIEKGLDYSVRTPQAVCAVRGTEFVVKTSKDKLTTAAVFSGKVGVFHYEKSGKLSKQAKIIKKMQETHVSLYKKPEVLKEFSKEIKSVRTRLLNDRSRRNKLKKEIIKNRKQLLKKKKKAILHRNQDMKKSAVQERRSKRPPRRGR